MRRRYIGGLWGGQLQCWIEGEFDTTKCGPQEPTEGSALCPKVARLSEDMLQFAEGPSRFRDLQIVDEGGMSLLANYHERRSFEAPWMHRYIGKYYSRTRRGIRITSTMLLGIRLRDLLHTEVEFWNRLWDGLRTTVSLSGRRSGGWSTTIASLARVLTTPGV